jgi:NAD(P)-dependent dehydrogenase (short-subunit alcohol dehydrogenase family)
MGEIVLVTGASTGLGKELALYLAEQGFDVYGTVRNDAAAAALAETARERGVSIRTLFLDVTDPASINSAVETVVSQSGSIYGLINNAGIGLRGYFEDLSPDEIQKVFDANLFGLMSVTRAVLPYMRKAHRGRIILMSSVGGRIGSVGVSAYCSTKFALEGFGESLFMELAPMGIQVVLVEPGIVKTERWGLNRGNAERAKDPDSPYAAWFIQSEQEANKLVQRSTATPRDVAAVVHRALTVARPKLRYMVGWKAKLAVALRRHLPGELFESIYFRAVISRVTRPPTR